MALHDRPALTEVLGILALCAVLLAVLAKMDNSAAREYAARAQQALREQASHAPARVKTPAPVPVEPRTESIGSRGPISIPVGAAWSPGTSATVAHTRVAPQPSPVAMGALHRIVGPVTAPDGVSERVAPAPARAVPAAPAVPAAEPGDPSRRGSLLLAIMAGCGLLMCLSGALILRLR
jgi:hypothetical protein